MSGAVWVFVLLCSLFLLHQKTFLELVLVSMPLDISIINRFKKMEILKIYSKSIFHFIPGFDSKSRC